MHANHTATADLVLEQLPSGDHAWLRPVAATELDRYRLNPDRVVIVDVVPDKPKFIARAECPQFVVQTQAVYLISHAPTADRVLQWFTDPNDIDLDVETLDFGTVEVLGQVDPNRSPDDEEPRYVLTEQGRRDLAMARAFDKGATVAAASMICRACGKPSINPLRAGCCIVCELLQPATCPACHQGQDTPSCSRREHWGVA
jgi:hypothetical protein